MAERGRKALALEASDAAVPGGAAWNSRSFTPSVQPTGVSSQHATKNFVHSASISVRTPTPTAAPAAPANPSTM